MLDSIEDIYQISERSQINEDRVKRTYFFYFIVHSHKHVH